MSNVCSACTFRHGYDDMNKLKKCCYSTCKEFDQDCEDICNDCIQKVKKKCTGWDCSVKKIPMEMFTEKNTMFQECVVKHSENKKDAFHCCLKNCGTDYECQEQCIDAYNATLPVVETFKKIERRSEQSFIILFTLLFVDILLFTRLIPKRVSFFIFIIAKVITLMLFFRLLRVE